MFTGIIEEMGKIKSVSKGMRSVILEIEANKVLEGTIPGDSIAVNGVCLTVTGIGDGYFAADVMPETVRCTGLGTLRNGDRVNLERALPLGGRLGGHVVTGHIDGTGRIAAFEKDDNAVWVTVSAGQDIMKYIIRKGSVAIDGISLTVADVGGGYFRVSVIPHTQSETVLVSKRIGDTVNLEHDMLAKYVEAFVSPEKTSGGLSLDFLRENGF